MRNSQNIRNDKLIKEKRHDVFPTKGDWPEPTMCQSCGAVYSKGRWSWATVEGKAHTTTCPACRRIQENFPAGYIEVSGAFFRQHENEILNLVQNTEKLEKSAHPLERIIAVEPNVQKTLITTTGIHIARRIGEAISRAYQGEYSIQYADGEKRIRVFWQRD
ncbi:MAG: BCAM0308 family protein [Anaerolineales bacterium]